MLLLFAVFILSYDKEPEASFTISKNPVKTKEVFILSNTSVDANNYEWNFGDTQTATDKSVYHVFK